MSTVSPASLNPTPPSDTPRESSPSPGTLHKLKPDNSPTPRPAAMEEEPHRSGNVSDGVEVPRGITKEGGGSAEDGTSAHVSLLPLPANVMD
jgi:hypothetical protein